MEQSPRRENDESATWDWTEEAVPEWTEQITVRAIVTSVVLSVLFSFIVCRLNLTTGVVPSLNVAAGLIGFAALKGYTGILAKAGLLRQPFTRQENTVVQTCVVASSGIAFSSGTASYLLGMSPTIAGQGEEGFSPMNVKTLSLGWMIGFLFLVSFVGLFSIVPLRKMMIMKFKLTYPSGTATAYLINSFHTPKGARLAKKQVSVLSKAFCFSFGSAFFQWFFAAADGCGFSSFPTFGLEALARRFSFDFSMTYVGVGMLCPYMVNISLLLGAVISWGIMWPLIERKRGDWYTADLSPTSLRGIQGYRVFISIAMILGDGLFHVAYLLLKTAHSLTKKANPSPSPSPESDSSSRSGSPERRRREYFTKDEIPAWTAVGGYVILAVLSTVTVPRIVPQLAWHHVMVVYVAAPVLAFCNAYGCGLTDWSLASNYGKLAIIVFAAWAGPDQGGVVAGLAACGVAMSIVSTASDLMQDFKTGYLTLASPRAMFAGQVVGTAVGCVVSPVVFWFFYTAYPVGQPGGSYPAPYATLYRAIALLGSQRGLSSLPKNCIALSAAFFAVAVLLNAVREVLRRRGPHHRLVPSPVCLAIPFYLGGSFAVDMCLGSLVLFAWRRAEPRRAGDFAPAVASGLICGESLWGVPAAGLALAGLRPPICMKFLSAAVNRKVDAFLG